MLEKFFQYSSGYSMCDRRGCPKAYHRSCVNRDETFFRAKGQWNCGWHLCSNCEKSAHYMCYTCTFSLCKPCIKDAVILCVRGNKGFCETCMKTIMMMEKRTVALVYELLSLTLWKKASIMKLANFRREFILPEKLNVLLLKHPSIFYVSNNGQELVDKDPLVVVKEKFGELMQEGLHEYNRRHHLVNLEKKKKRGLVLGRSNEDKDVISEMSDPEDQGDRGGLFDSEERKRFYKVLFDDGAL